MIIITDRSGDIHLPVEEGLLEWLQTNYPYSQYHLAEIWMKKKRPKMSEADLESALEALKEEFETLTAFTIEENQMAKAKAKAAGPVNKLSDKLTKVNESFTINMYDNGYMIEVGGRDDEDNWKTAKIMVGTVEELLVLVREATEIERAD